MKNIYKKGQAATEFLMTYGWAILAIVIVAAVLWNMGIFKGQCTKTAAVQVFPSGESLAVSDWAIDTNNDLTIRLKNLAGNDISVSSSTLTIGSDTGTNSTALPVSAGGDATLVINAAGTGTAGNCFNDAKVTLKYSVSGGVSHDVAGTLSGKY